MRRLLFVALVMCSPMKKSAEVPAPTPVADCVPDVADYVAATDTQRTCVAFAVHLHPTEVARAIVVLTASTTAGVLVSRLSAVRAASADWIMVADAAKGM